MRMRSGTISTLGLVFLYSFFLSAQGSFKNDSAIKLVNADPAEELTGQSVNSQQGEYALGTDPVVARKKSGGSDKIIGPTSWRNDGATVCRLKSHSTRRSAAAAQSITQDASQCAGTEPAFVFGDEVKSDHRELIRQGLMAGVRYICSKAGIGAESLTIYAFADLDKISEAYSQWFSVPPRQAREIWTSGSSAVSGPKVLFLYAGSPWLSSVLASSDLKSLFEVLSHEYFHVIQWKLAGQDLIGVPDNEVPIGGPRWLIEGAAALVGSLSVDDSALYSFGLDKEQKRSIAASTTALLNSVETWKGLAGVGDAGYALGFLACDSLIPDSQARSSGIGSFAAFWDSIGKGKTWQEAFQSVFGKSVADLYQQFEENRSHAFPPSSILPFTITLDGSYPPGTDLAQGNPADLVPYLFRVAGFDVNSLTPHELDAALNRPLNAGWSLTKLGRDLIVVYIRPDTPTGSYGVGLDLPDGRHSETIFRHIATSGSGVANPVPIVDGLAPSHRQAGDAGFILTLNGNDFVNGATARWNGLKRKTKLRSSNTQLEVALTGADIATDGQVTVTVVNPVPGGGESSAQIFVVGNVAAGPRIASASVSGKKLFVSGSGFESGSKVLLNGEAQKTSNDDVNPVTTLVAKKSGKKIARGQTVTIQVRNPDGSLSPEFSFTRPL